MTFKPDPVSISVSVSSYTPQWVTYLEGTENMGWTVTSAQGSIPRGSTVVIANLPANPSWWFADFKKIDGLMSGLLSVNLTTANLTAFAGRSISLGITIPGVLTPLPLLVRL